MTSETEEASSETQQRRPEVITLQIGGFGLHTGNRFWSDLLFDHNLDVNGQNLTKDSEEEEEEEEEDEVQGCPNVFFDESYCDVFVPRTLLIDTSPLITDWVQQSKYSDIFRSDRVLAGNCPTGNNYATGYNLAENKEFPEQIIQGLRATVQECDSLETFQIFHSTSGGTGSGTTSFIVEHIKDTFENAKIACFSLVPDKVPDSTIAPINTMLSIGSLHQQIDLGFILTNDAMRNFRKRLNLKTFCYDNMNYCLAKTISTLTSNMRFKTGEIVGYSRISAEIVQDGMPYLCLGFSPFCDKKNATLRQFTLRNCIADLYKPFTQFCSSKSRSIVEHAASIVFRGELKYPELCHEFERWDKNSNNGPKFNRLLSTCTKPTRGIVFSAATATLTSVVGDVLAKRVQEFNKYKEKKIFYHLFENNGITGDEIQENVAAIEQLVTNYGSYISDSKESYSLSSF